MYEHLQTKIMPMRPSARPRSVAISPSLIVDFAPFMETSSRIWFECSSFIIYTWIPWCVFLNNINRNPWWITQQLYLLVNTKNCKWNLNVHLNVWTFCSFCYLWRLAFHLYFGAETIFCCCYNVVIDHNCGL